MTDYSKRKNDELASLCKDRGLPHTGKKADLVKRLEDHDAAGQSGSTATTNAQPPAAAAAMEDEIDWDDEPPATTLAHEATTQPAADALAAGGLGEVGNPQNVPNQIPALDPAATNDLSVSSPSNPAAAAPPPPAQEPEKDFSTGLRERTLDEEIAARKARARKFGMSEDSDEIRALERAKKFGTGDVPGLLNRALPNERARDGGVRKHGRGGKGGLGRGSGIGRGEKERTPGAGVSSGGGGGVPGWMSKDDREALERRKAKFSGAVA